MSTNGNSAAATPPTLVASNLSKVFPGQIALDGVGLKLYPGKVHALLGENGSGKSTFIKILSGYHQPEPGAQMSVNGEPVVLGSPAASAAAGMRFIHQDRGLVDELDIVDNLALGNGYGTHWWVSLHSEAAAAREVLAPFGLDVDVRRRVGELSTVEQSIVAIARALRGTSDHPPQVLVLDEPTEALSRREVDQLFEAVRVAAAAGTAVLYVSHNIMEVLAIADTISVLRDGHLIATRPAGELDRQSVIELIIGRQLEDLTDSYQEPKRGVTLGVEMISGDITHGISFEVHDGEILGLAGIGGSGRDELPYLLGGARPWHSGSLTIRGRVFQRLTPREALSAGVVFVPGDRSRESAIPSLAAHENVTLPGLDGGGALRWLSTRRDRNDAREWMHRTDVRPCRPERLLSTFSGGNQQKIVLARALRCQPKLLILDHPVQGVDIGAKFAIYEQLLEAANQGIAVVVSSSDPEDLVAVCHRVLVFRNGEISAELHRDSLTIERITEHCLS